MSDTTMTRSERKDLADVIRMRARVTKSSLETLAADRRAEVEAQLSAIHQSDDERWRAITAVANRALQEADAQLAAICQAQGIPEKFRPSLHLSWYGRGENATAERRAELRKLAYARIDADRKAGVQLVDAWAAEKLTTLVAGGLSSDDAKAFLDGLPSPDALLPSIRITPELGIETARQLTHGAAS